MKRLLMWSLSIVITLTATTSMAANSATLDNSVLTIIDPQSSQDDPIEVTISELKQLPSYVITTNNPWEEGQHHYKGFNPNELLAQQNMEGIVIRLTAYNQYITEIPLEDFSNGQAIIAYEMDGKAISVRHKGPLMVIYDFDRYPELKAETYYGRSIWQIYKLQVLHAGS